MSGGEDSKISIVARLARRDDHSVRPVLLRVMTDMFVGRERHPPADILQFEEIALRLLQEASEDTQIAVAARLAGHPDAPRRVLAWLLACGGTPAAIILESAAAIEPQALRAAALWGAREEAVAVSRRKGLDMLLIEALVDRPEPEVAIALARNRAIDLYKAAFATLVRRARADAELATALIERAPPGADLTSLFFVAGAPKRMAIIAQACRHDASGPARPTAHQAAQNLRLERLAGEDRQDLYGMLAQALHCTPAQAATVADDDGGEPLALALAALGLEEAAATRIFLTGPAAVAHSIVRMRVLRQIVKTTPPRTARRILHAAIGIEREATPGETRRAAAYAPVTDSAASATPSRAAPPAARRPEPRLDSRRLREG